MLEVDVLEVDVVEVDVLEVDVVEVDVDVVGVDVVVEEGGPDVFSDVLSGEPVGGVVSALRDESLPQAARPTSRRAAAVRTAEVSRDRSCGNHRSYQLPFSIRH